MKKLKYDLILNIKSLILFERLTKTAFQKFNGTIEQVLPLLYCMIVANNDFKETYENTIKYLFSDEKFLKELSDRLEKLLKYEEQFNISVGNMTKEETADINTDKEDKPIFISQLIPILVSDCNLDINYIMNEMSYIEIDSYINYRDTKYKSDLEEKRLFTYLTILPHIDSKKCSIQQLLPFDWEIKQKKEQGLKTIKQDKHKLDEFIKSGKLKFNPTNNNDVNTNTQ